MDLTSRSVDIAKLQSLIDKEEIREVLHRYCRANDRGDSQLLSTVFHDDAVDDHGAYLGDIPGFISHVERMFHEDTPFGTSALQNMQHSLGTINIELDGDTAYSEAYFVSTPITHPDEQGRVTIAPMLGRYLDRFERRNGDWRIAQRRVVKDVRDVRVVENDPTEGYVLGGRTNDPLDHHGSKPETSR